MAVIGKYCKAYPLKRLRQYEQWTEELENVREETQEIDGKQVQIKRDLSEDDFLYLQENYIVTDGIFKDENVIFAQVTDEWKTFCHERLQFENPLSVESD